MERKQRKRVIVVFSSSLVKFWELPMKGLARCFDDGYLNSCLEKLHKLWFTRVFFFRGLTFWWKGFLRVSGGIKIWLHILWLDREHRVARVGVFSLLIVRNSSEIWSAGIELVVQMSSLIIVNAELRDPHRRVGVSVQGLVWLGWLLSRRGGIARVLQYFLICLIIFKELGGLLNMFLLCCV